MYTYAYDDWREAGKVSFEAINLAKGLVKPGAKLLDIAEAIEGYAFGKGLSPAFPANISINENAAHYTPSFNDESTFGEHDVVKIDFGARKNKGAGDTALTVDLSGEYGKLVEASEEALQEALSMVKAGRKVNEIGRAISKVAEKYACKPIQNLGGHGITEEELHAELFIPNFDNGDETELKEGQIAAIEPFMTTGEGYVVDSEQVEIFAKTMHVNARSQSARKAQEIIEEKYGTYPFAMRWLVKELGSEFEAKRAISELAQLGAIEAYPVLVEKTKGIVAQTEVSFIVTKDSCEVLTR